MKKVWILFPVFVVWFLSQRQDIQSPLVHTEKQAENVPALKQVPQPADSVGEKKWGLPEHHERKTQSFNSPLGNSVSYTFSQNGVPILGMGVRLKETPDGSLVEEENTYHPIPEVPIDRSRLEERVEELKKMTGRYDLSSLSADSLVILVREGMKEGELGFATTALDKSGTGQPTQLIIRYDDGKILSKSFGRKEF